MSNWARRYIDVFSKLLKLRKKEVIDDRELHRLYIMVLSDGIELVETIVDFKLNEYNKSRLMWWQKIRKIVRNGYSTQNM